ncbi:MAG: protease modulator HflC [Candidatus Krumholzibacteriia bacterium]
MNTRTGVILIAIIAAMIVVALGNPFYTVNEWEQVVITQFGKPIGDAVREPGLHLKMPFIHKINPFERRWLEWDGDADQVPTRDKKFIWVDAYARWRISDPLLFFQSVQHERRAQTRLDDILDGATRKAIANWDLIEVVRSSNRALEDAPEITDVETESWVREISHGRHKITRDILDQASKTATNYGIELVDVRIKRINYVETVREKVYDRMISERKRIAQKSRSEGEGRAAEIRGQKERELKRITSEAYRTAQEVRGRADAKATRIYAEAYGKAPDFYAFMQTLESYQESIDEKTWLVLSTDGDFYRYLKNADIK